MYLDEKPPRKSRLSPFKKKIIALAIQVGLTRIGRSLWSDTLTVLNYHRIGFATHPEFDTFRANVSANPDGFAEQMDYLSRWFNVVSLSEVAEWLIDKKPLPPHAALITFDDGYLDNYIFAYPILRERDFPAVIFLTTGHIQKDIPFFWDLVAYCFHHTTRDFLTFPNGKEEHWSNKTQKELAVGHLVEKLKLMSEEEKGAWVTNLPRMLNVAIPTGYFMNLMLNWDQIREMKAGGLEFGGHTVSHPILTRVPLERAEKEIASSKVHIEKELNVPIHGFAYPNGGKEDFNPATESLAAKSGYRAAFTLLNGPEKLREVSRNPFAIRRIFISYKHTLPDFSLLTHPINRIRK